MSGSEQEKRGDDHAPEEKWVRIREMKMGTEDPLQEFADEVVSAMEHHGNEVGRPLVMKVSVEVFEGELKRPEDDDGDSTEGSI